MKDEIAFMAISGKYLKMTLPFMYKSDLHSRR